MHDPYIHNPTFAAFTISAAHVHCSGRRMASSAWSAALAAAAEPARALYSQQTAERMATDPDALGVRDAAIHFAWVSLGIEDGHASSALKRGSGAAEWLVSNGHCPAGAPPQTQALATTDGKDEDGDGKGDEGKDAAEGTA